MKFNKILEVPGSWRLEELRLRSSRLGRLAVVLWDQAVCDKLLVRASGLAYTSLLAVVPLFVVAFALFTGFEGFDGLKHRVKGLLLDQFLPAGQEQITRHINTFVENSRDLSFLGIVILIITAILLLENIDSNFNEIWHVEGRRSLVSRLTAYSSVLVFGTVLIGISIVISARVRAALLTDIGFELSFLSALGSWLFPLVSSFLAFWLMFLIIPSTRIHVRSAALGAIFTAVTWELGKNLFAASIGQSVRYSTLYGSLATIPIFLVWLYVAWVLVLVGLEVAYVHQNQSALVRRRLAEAPTGREQLELALGIAVLVARRFNAGEPPPTEDDLVEASIFGSRAVGEITDTLRSGGLIRPAGDSTEGEGWVPAKPLDRVAVADVLKSVWGARPADPPDESKLARECEELVARLESAGREAIGELSLREIVDRAHNG